MTPAAATEGALPAPTRRRGCRGHDLTLGRLLTLVRLHRRGLDGAGTELLDLLDVRRPELAGALGLSSVELPLPGGPEQLPALARLVEARALASKEDGVRSRRAEAEAAAARLAAEAAFGLGGVELDLGRLVEVVGIGAFDLLGFRLAGEVHAIPRTTLATLVREIATLRLDSLRVVPEDRCLRVGWAGARHRGSFRLVLEPPDVRRTCVVVDLDAALEGPSDVAELDPSAVVPWLDPRPRRPFASLAPRLP
ncbi:MAG: hypothetical protein U0230_05150 [Polyangiales bacterium]